MWTGRTEIAITIEDLNIWWEIVEIKKQKTELEKEENWNTRMEIIDKEEWLKKEMRTIVI